MAQTKTLNVIPNGAITRVHVSQGDIGRTIYFNLYEGSLAYTPTSGDVITCVGTKPSGLGFTITCSWSGNVVTCVTTEAMTDESGIIDAELVITSSDESTVLGTSNFKLCVEANPHTSETTDGTQTTAQSLQVQIDNLNTRVTTLESSSSGSGLTDDIKVALLQIAEKVAYIDENGQTYYDDLYDALYPPVTLSSITCVYTQSGTVYDNASLSDLTSDLVVTAHYDDSTTSTVSSSDYTLSGTLSVGTSTITVTYGGKTTTFTVTVTASPTVSSITATYTQSGTVYNTASLSDLVSDLVVVANYTDSSTVTLTSDDYTLSGTLAEGTSTITVTYESLTTTFTVTVTALPTYSVSEYMLYNCTSATLYTDEGTTTTTLASAYGTGDYIPVNESSATDVTFTLTIGSSTVWRNCYLGCILESTKGSVGTGNFAHSYNMSGGTIYNVTSLANYYYEGSGNGYTYAGNVYKGTYSVPAGCSIVIMSLGTVSSGGNTLNIDTANSSFVGG